ncbi:MAG TPA: hypothetical protein VG406_28630 [Isosphaeraceae bacterium]|jgi:WD40 repeat protein|nr:hypothetical protein [Isosphaeraceae bacterium]
MAIAEGPFSITQRWVVDEIKLWDVAAGREVVTLTERDHPVVGVAFGPDADSVTSLDAGNTVKVRRLDDGRVSHVVRSSKSPSFGVGPSSVVFGAESRRVVAIRSAGTSPGVVTTWDVTRSLVRGLSGQRGTPRCVAMSPDGKLVASVNHEQILTIWDFETGKIVRTFEAKVASRLILLAYSPEARLLVAADEDGALHVWSGDGRPGQALPSGRGRVLAMSFRGGSLRVASSGPPRRRPAGEQAQDGSINVWNIGMIYKP